MKKIPKSRFKPHALAYFREVQRTRKALVITDRGVPVVKIVPYSDEVSDPLDALRGSVLEFDRPTEPVALEDWEALN